MREPTPQQPASVEQIKAGILAMLEKRGNGLTFVNLEDVPGFTGKFVMELGSRNIIYWLGVSEAACDAFQSLQDDGLIELKSTLVLTYHIDGKLPNLPCVTNNGVTRANKNKAWAYKKPHWLPMAIYKGKNYRRQVAA